MSLTNQGTAVLYERQSGLAAAAAELAAVLKGTVVEVTDGDLPAGWMPAEVCFLLAVHSDHLEEHLRAIERSVTNCGRRACLGLITGLDLSEVSGRARDVVRRPRRYGRPWILTEEDVSSVTNSDCEILQPKAMTVDDLARLGERSSEFAIVVGHGREDILYFGKRAYCGQRREVSPFPSNCRPDQCSYPQEKLPIEALSADLLVLLSCNAGRIGSGIMAPSCRLGLTAAGTCRTVIAPARLYTHTRDLTELVLRSIQEGVTAAEARARADRFQAENFGEKEVFVLLGDPRTSRISSARGARTMHYAELVASEVVEILRQIVRLSDQLELMNLCAADATAIGLMAHSCMKRLQSLPISSSRLSGNALDVTGLRARLIRIAALELDMRIASEYFWISNSYFIQGMPEQESACSVCGGSAARQSFKHFRLSHGSRSRLTCRVCGIVEDKPCEGRSTLSALMLDERTVSVSLFVAAQPACLVVGLNGWAEEKAVIRVFNVDGKELPVPVELNGGANRLNVEVDHLMLRPGVYFLKLLLVSPEGITESSMPIRTWRSEEHVV